MATIVLTWSHPTYIRNRDTPGFVGFSEEYASPYPQNVMNVDSVVNARGMQKRSKNMDGFSGAYGASTVFRNPSDPSKERVQINNLGEWHTQAAEHNLTLQSESNFPNYQPQVLPEGVRGRHVRLVKIDTAFSKMHHNFESVHIDMSRIVDVDMGFHSTDCHTRPNELVLYSDGCAKVESHGYGTIIGPMRDSECQLGIIGFRHVPRMGMGWAGLSTGNDVGVSASGIETTAHHDYDMSLRGHTNGHLLYVSIVLELV